MKKLILFLIIILTVAITYSCQNAREKRVEKFTEKMLEKSIGEDVDIDVDGESITIHTDEGKIVASTGKKKWPNEIPSSVPKFNYGKIENVSLQEYSDGKSWAIIYENVPGDALSGYEKILKDKGFETSLTGMAEVGGMVMGEKGNLNVVVMIGEGGASVAIMQEKQ